MKLSEIEFYLEDFLLYCELKNLSEKTLKSYDQSIKLFLVCQRSEYEIEDPEKVRPAMY